ncbi:hypothetical protein N7539_007597 [Penicillium diatomitis]|uniref:Uncharacterized protein n=1 Tax=Penicillium diatomitis TaxID=2819901 RepID=A0A9W9WVE1_9EURO|nr:uncharacterized protein N7539_007597 [Penicillium diatomitis]KAJ5477453.1 hypothetical protein N7539_007597 [Penicillium diatomitis]
MPRQQTQSRAPKERGARKPPTQRVPKGRGLDALSRAEEQIPVKLGVRRNRLGDYDDGEWRKRPTGGDDDDDDEDNEPRPDYKRRRTEVSDEVGSDGEGHRWTLGQVDSDDDESLDSDEALGSSDEERFEGFTFRGSSSNKSTAKAKPKKADKKQRSKISLSEETDGSDDDMTGMNDEDEDDDEEDGIDLLTAWDMNTAAEERAAQKASEKVKRTAEGEDSDDTFGTDGDSEDDPSEGDSDLSLSDVDDDAEAQESGLSKLQDFVKSMETDRSRNSKQRSQEQGVPTEYGLTSSRKLTVADLLPSITDSRLKSSLKHVDAAPQATRTGITGKLDAPLAKRQQDKLDRAAAYEKSKETLDRWLETVKANRKAEHLTFPLPDPDAQQFHRLDVVQPKNELESTIQEILVESGLAEANGKSAEDQLQGLEELKARALPLEEIQARRAELRKRRDLLFREEVRAKRIKKIKSKAYRRVHRKERERMEQQERQALLESGVDIDEAERDENERKRAEARMSSKHRDSKWAKSNKQTGRTAWDEDARNSAADLAMREEELRKRIEGKRVSRGDEDYLGSSSSESEDEDPWASDADERNNRKLRAKLAALERDSSDHEEKGPHSALFSMKFMKNAEAARKEQNDAELRRLNRELEGEDSQSEAGSEAGRRKFGQAEKTQAASRPRVLAKDELEDATDSDAEDTTSRRPEERVATAVDQSAKQKSTAVSHSQSRARTTQTMFDQKSHTTDKEEENPWLVQTERNNRRRGGAGAEETLDIALDAPQPQASQVKESSKSGKPVKAASSRQQEETMDSDDEEQTPVLLKNHDLVKRAFAGDEVVQEFEQEKMDTIAEEGDKVVDNTLEGWGSWAGDGISNREKKRQKRNLTTIQGVKPEKRKDAKLSRVIINEKRIQKNKKYMASQLPHEFETKAQYERSLRMPIGPEWSTKETYQSSTKPRVMIKQGIIKPLEKPLL